MCLNICGFCYPCIDGTARFKFEYNDRKITKMCEWIANKQMAQQYTVDGVSGGSC